MKPICSMSHWTLAIQNSTVADRIGNAAEVMGHASCYIPLTDWLVQWPLASRDRVDPKYRNPLPVGSVRHGSAAVLR